MQRNSQQDADAVDWASTGLALGTSGLDLRQPSSPTSLTRLLNARFLDDRTLVQREGHRGILVRDKSNLAPLGATYSVSDDWVYGHGERISSVAAGGWENAHHPIPKRGQATFNYDGTNVVFTGDRVLMVPDEGPALGQSTFWQRGGATTPLDRGVPAYLPLQVDGYPPTTISGDYVETALTSKYRMFVHTTTGATTLTVWLLDRVTGTIVHTSDISGASDSPVDCKIIESADVPVAIWRDSATHRLYINTWNGTAWTGATQVVPEDVYSFDVATVPGGFYLLWRTAAPSTATLCVGYYTRTTKQSTPFVFGTALNLTGITLGGALALGVSPLGELGVAVDAAGLYFRVFSSTASPISGLGWVSLDGATTWDSGLAVVTRGLKEQSGVYTWVVHASRSAASAVVVRSVLPIVGTGYSQTVVTRYNSRLASKSFRVGDEVFAWCRASNAGTHYLIGGAGELQVCGYADREEAIVRVTSDGNYALPHVLADPADDRGVTFTWARPYNTGQTYAHGGNVRTGDLDFLPQVSFVHYGKSTYLSGSAVRAWDGVALGDAGFQDYPIITNLGTTATVSPNGVVGTTQRYYRVYAVRYNARGERFQSAAVSKGPFLIPGTIIDHYYTDLTIATLPDTNHSDVIFEIYRTENEGTTFYLVGTVANSLTAATVTFQDQMTDATLLDQGADPHAAGVGALSEIEEWGPLGCAILSVTGDRMWGAGGQVPPGVVQFSKLKEEGEGAGFDDLAGFQTVNPEGHDVTSISPLNDTTVVFQKDRLFVIAGTGPDNYGRNSFVVPTIQLADGATTHFGTCLTQMGVFYWGDNGPRLLSTSYQVQLIAQPVRSLAETMVPSGVVSSLARQEVVWYTADGNALLLNYLGQIPRWAQWTGLHIAGCSDEALITTDGQLFIAEESAVGDNGQAFEFAWATGNIRPEQLLQGYTLLRSVGVAGDFAGAHKLRMRVSYNGSPLWTDEWVWEPDTGTWLTSGTDHADETPAEIDAEKPTDRSGAYLFHKRVTRQNCHYFRVAVSNIESDRPTFVPFELSMELGGRGGLGRNAVNTFGA